MKRDARHESANERLQILVNNLSNAQNRLRFPADHKLKQHLREFTTGSIP
jgi:hypothetical protein